MREGPHPQQRGELGRVPSEVPLGAPYIDERGVRRERLHDGADVLGQTEQHGQRRLDPAARLAPRLTPRLTRRLPEAYIEDHPALPGLWCHNFRPVAACFSPGG